MKNLLTALLAVLMLLLGSGAHAATYTFRSDSYAWESAATAISTWDRTCTSYPGDDDKATISFTGGFKFTFAGTAYTSVRVLTNGGLQFGSDTGFFRSYTNTALPAGAAGGIGGGCAASATNNVILAYWTDLNPSQSGSGGVTWQQKGTAPNRYVVVSWNGVYQYNTSTPYTFQIILYESGEFKFQYGNANASGSRATIGVQIDDSDYTQYSYNSGYNANGSAIRWFVASGTPTRRAEYRFDEYSYSGRVGEVNDSSTNNNDGVRPSASTATTSPTARVCRSLTVPANTNATSHAIDTVLNVSASIGNAGAVTFWYAGNTAWNNAAAMLLDATANTAQPFFLVRQSDGSLRATVTDSAGTTLTATTPAQGVAAGAWRHVAFSWRLAAGAGQSSIRIYVGGSQVGAVSGTTNGNLHPGLGSLFVGDNRSSTAPANATLNSANGLIDEMRVYNYEISAIELTADMNPVHACPPPLDHYELSVPAVSLTCVPTTITIEACSNNSSPCTAVETSVNGTAVLSASAGTLANTVVSFNQGVATTTLSLPGGVDNTSVTVTLGGESTAAANARRCCPDGVACYAASSCPTTFRRAGFIVSSNTTGGPATLPTQTAGTASGAYYLRAVRENTSTQACEAAVTGNRSVNWGYQCINPATCSASNLMSVASGTPTATTVIARNNSGLSTATTAVPMSFDSNGNAAFTVNFADVGSTSLFFNFTATSAAGNDLISGSSQPFVTKPAGFSVTQITDAASPFTANPSPTGAGGGSFVKAGAPFAARVTALTSTGTATPNFGKESAPEGVLLTPTLVLPSPGTAGSIPPAVATVAGGQFTAGIANLTNLAYSEVGIITISPSLASGNYLNTGSGAIAGTTTGNIGRFIPAGFTVTAIPSPALPSPRHRSALSCSPASTFTYLDETFQLAFRLAAVNTGGATTSNYTGAFTKLPPGTASRFNLAGIDTTTGTRFSGARLAVGSSAGAWSSGAPGASPLGTADITLNAAALRVAAPDGPFQAGFGIAPVDDDQVRMMAFDLDADAAVAGNDRTTLGQIPLRLGRLRLQNAMSGAGRDLKLGLTAQYWNGTAFVTNILDSCTTVTAANLSFGNFRKQLGTSDFAMTPNSVKVDPTSATFLTLRPTGSKVGSVDVAIALGSTNADESCLKNSWTRSVNASSGANLTALRGAWCGGSSDPSARATWGLTRGSDGVVFQRENY